MGNKHALLVIRKIEIIRHHLLAKIQETENIHFWTGTSIFHLLEYIMEKGYGGNLQYLLKFYFEVSSFRNIHTSTKRYMCNKAH